MLVIYIREMTHLVMVSAFSSFLRYCSKMIRARTSIKPMPFDVVELAMEVVLAPYFATRPEMIIGSMITSK